MSSTLKTDLYQSFIAQQYAEALADLTVGVSPLCDFQNDSVPSLEDVSTTLLHKYTPEQITIINCMQKPVLQLLPQKKNDAYLVAAHGYKAFVAQMSPFISRRVYVMWQTADEVDSLHKWRVAITEGAHAPAVLPGDDLQKTLHDRQVWFKKVYGPHAIGGVDFRSYTLLQQRGLREGRPVDDLWHKDETWTILNGLPNDGYWVASGRWTENRVYFSERDSMRPSYDARFRLSVIIDLD